MNTPIHIIREQAGSLLGSRALRSRLRRLFALERPPRDERFFDDTTLSEVKVLRNGIPPVMLGQYDRLRLRGKVGVAPVSDDACGGCKGHISKSSLLRMEQSDEMGMCDHCGAFVYLEDAQTKMAVGQS